MSLESEAMEQEAELEIAKQTHAAEMKERENQATHARETARLSMEHEHETGLKGADLMLKAQDSAESREMETRESAADRAHESTETAAQRRAETERQQRDHQHQQKSLHETQKGQERLIKLKPPVRKAKGAT